MRYRFLILPTALVVALGVWLLIPRGERVSARWAQADSSTVAESQSSIATQPSPETENTVETQEATPDSSSQNPAVIATPKPAALAAIAELPEGPEIAPGLQPVTVLENMRTAFHQYSQRFGGNPVGVNREIAAALNGGNPRQVVFLNAEDGLVVNGRGELVDNWGTPFFFHQLSRTDIEIRSAGPDRKMWNSDDLVLK